MIGLGAVEPPEQVGELIVELGREPLRCGDGDAQFTEQVQAELDRISPSSRSSSGIATSSTTCSRP